MDPDSCGICMESLADGRPTTLLCSGLDERGAEWAHMFHTECIQGWINANMGRAITCPICRREVEPINLANLPLDFWIPLELFLDGAHLIIPGYIVRKFILSIQGFFEYQRLEALDWAALGQFVVARQRVENERVLGNPRINTLVNSVGSHYRMNMTATAVEHQGQYMWGLVNDMMGLMILLMIFNILRTRIYGRQGGGGGMVLRIGKESINVPPEFKNTVQEAFDSLQKTLSKQGGRRGTRRRRR